MAKISELPEIVPQPADTALLMSGGVAVRAPIAAFAALGGPKRLTLTSGQNPAKFVATTPGAASIVALATELTLVAPTDRTEAHAGVELDIEGFTGGDSRQVLREDGAQIEAGAWRAGQRLRLYYGADGTFRLVEPARRAAAVTSEYQLIALSHARPGA